MASDWFRWTAAPAIPDARPVTHPPQAPLCRDPLTNYIITSPKCPIDGWPLVGGDWCSLCDAADYM